MNSMASILYQNKQPLNVSDDTKMLYYYNSSCLHPDFRKPNPSGGDVALICRY